ncbi:MAG: ABC transporter ATP-binding protein [Thermodesulfovibrionales bacterium]|nr:ABC transporter ATP-binding protein [Thermodesulfovibrionales bacterium]
MSLLELKGLSISFRTRPVEVVSDLSFQLNEGEVFGLVGESGCGKSLTALSIMGILPQNFKTGGVVNLRGRNLLSLGPEEMRDIRGREIGMVFQEPMTSLNPVLRVGYQIAEAVTSHFRVSKEEARERTLELLKAVRMPSPHVRMKEYPHQMSGGMRQRVMIAMAIACNPAVLIADEPTTALDVTIEAQILELLNGLMESGNMAVLLITHDLGIIRENAKQVAIMYAGRLVEKSPVEGIFTAARHPYTIGLMESLPGQRGVALKPIPGSVPKPGMLPPGCKFSDRCRFMKPECQADEPPLRQVTEGHFSRCIRAEEMRWPS